MAEEKPRRSNAEQVSSRCFAHGLCEKPRILFLRIRVIAMMSRKLSKAIGKHRNDRNFHEMVRKFQSAINDRVFTIRDLKDAILIIEYDEELRKRGAR